MHKQLLILFISDENLYDKWTVFIRQRVPGLVEIYDLTWLNGFVADLAVLRFRNRCGYDEVRFNSAGVIRIIEMIAALFSFTIMQIQH